MFNSYTFTVTVKADDLNSAEMVIKTAVSWAYDYAPGGHIESYEFTPDEA